MTPDLGALLDVTCKVVAETLTASQNVGTLGVALTTCTLPGQEPSGRLDAETIEVGLWPPPARLFVVYVNYHSSVVYSL